jgi:transcriptional regulator with XRE-family HTH domain
MRGVMPTDYPMPFAQMLRNIRVSLGLSQEELAERFGVTTSDINLFEQNYIVDSEAKRKILRQMSFAINWS